MYRYFSFLTLAALSGILALALISSAQAQDFTATLSGYQEVPPISTPASGDFELASEAPFDYTLTYDGLTSEILAAHIHFGQPGVNGGVIIFLCNNYAVNPTPPGSPPDCTGTSGEVQGTLVVADVIGPDAQGIEPGEGVEALAAIEAGVTYANVHSDLFRGGEIRGAISMMEDDDGDGDLEERLSRLENAFRRLVEAVRNHTHTYLTGRGQGHNNTEATTGPAVIED